MGLERFIDYFRAPKKLVEVNSSPDVDVEESPDVSVVEQEKPVESLDQLLAFTWGYANFVVDKLVANFTDLPAAQDKDSQYQIFFEGASVLAQRMDVLFTMYKTIKMNLEAKIEAGNLQPENVISDELRAAITTLVAEIKKQEGFIHQAGQTKPAKDTDIELVTEQATLLHDFKNLLTPPAGFAQLYFAKFSDSPAVVETWVEMSYRSILQAKYFLSESVGVNQEAVPYPEEIIRVAEFFKDQAARMASNPQYDFKMIVDIDRSVTENRTKTSNFTLLLAMRVLGNITQNTDKAYRDMLPGQSVRKELHIGLRVEAGKLIITFDDFAGGFPLRGEESLELTLGRLLKFDKPFLVRAINFDGTSFWRSAENSGNGLGMAGLKNIIENIFNGSLTAGNRLGLGLERGGARIEVQVALE